MIHRWLAHRCIRDPRFPEGRISTIYYDDRALSLLHAKLNSDFVKRKVRLRWYADAATGVPAGTAFLEIKEKVGGRRSKARVPTPLAAAEVAGLGLQDPRLRGLLELLRNEGIWVAAGLQPCLLVRFQRRRFIEPTTGARVSVDMQIEAPRANPMMLPATGPVRLAHAVVEIKGPMDSLPHWLAPLREMGCRRESFSKYARCYLKLAAR